jgi:hypothetical protein
MVLPSLMCRHLCSPGVFAVIVITLLPLLRLRHCHHQAGVVALVTKALLPLLVHRHLCRCHNNIVALVALVPLPIFHGCCQPFCTSNLVLIAMTSLPSRHMCVINVVAPALLPPLSWRICAVMLVTLALSCWCHCPCHAGIVALGALALAPMSCRPLCPTETPAQQWQQCQHDKAVKAKTMKTIMPAKKG